MPRKHPACDRMEAASPASGAALPDAHEKRWFELFLFAYKHDFGTLWFLRESLLKREYPSYDQNSTRRAHPGLSINRLPAVGIRGTIRMLIGTRRRHGLAFEVAGVMDSGPADQNTFFSVLRPLRAMPVHFLPRPDLEPEITRNTHKPALNQEEREELEKCLSPAGRKHHA